MSGAVGWLFVAPTVATVTHNTLSATELAVSVVVAAGSALLPDIDSPSSTVSRSFGLPSVWLSRGVATASRGVYQLTRSRRDDRRSGGHRALTHTLVFAAALGAAVALCCSRWGSTAALVVLFITTGLAMRGLMSEWAVRQGWLATTAVSAIVAYAMGTALPPNSYWWFGIAVGFGMVVHLLGDMITKQGCPVLWPLPIGGERWRDLGTPRFLRIRAGGTVEKVVVLPALTILALVAVYLWRDDLGVTTTVAP